MKEIPEKLSDLRNACSLFAVKEVTRAEDKVIISAFLNHGYKPNKGMYNAQWIAAAKELGLEIETLDVYRKYTLNQFIRNHPKGVFFVSVRGHALVVRDGKVRDVRVGMTGGRKQVWYAHRVLNAPEVTEEKKSTGWVVRRPSSVKRIRSASYNRYFAMWEYVRENPTCGVEDVFKNTPYTRADFNHDTKKGFVEV